MENGPMGEPESKKTGGKSNEEELRRLYPHYDASCKSTENRPFLFRYSPFRQIYDFFSDSFASWGGQVKDPKSSTGWRERTDQEKRQYYREQDEKHRKKKRY
jgi:hypothetical protein